MMARIIVEAEQSPFYSPPSSVKPGARANVAEAIARNACDVAAEIGARLVVAFTESGLTARYASKARPVVPIVALSPNPPVLRRLALLWGVRPCFMEVLRNTDDLIERANAYLLANGFVSPGDKFVASFGAPVGVAGTTNSIRVKVVE
jgi:pyruvate kinase